ncbi:MAG: hypothetical protein KAZ87_00295 [Spirochaetes bacterium]|nr:hypothetical protein [Spirochaetota bacterium]
MGNENEVKYLLEKTKSVFLPGDFSDPDGKPELYSLEEEFRKTKRNKNRRFIGLVFLFLLAIISIALIITFFVQERGKNQKVDISSFQDLKLKEMIDSSQKKEGELEIARKELGNLEMEYSRELARLKRDFDELKHIIQSRDISEEEKKAQIAKLNTEYNLKIRKTKSKYSPKMSVKNSEINRLEKEIREKENELGKSSDNKISILEGESKLSALEKKKLSGTYENRIDQMSDEAKEEIEYLIKKYNPDFAETELKRVLDKPVKGAAKVSPLNGVENDILSEKVSTEDKISRLQTNVNDSYKLNDRMEQIPYINSPGKTVVHISAKFKDVVNTYDGITVGLVNSLRKKNQQLKFYDYAFYFMIKDEKESGYILDPRDTSLIGVYMNKVHIVKSGDLGYVFRQDDEFIATIKFKRSYGVTVAELVKAEKGLKMQPFDKIMLKKVKP